MESSDNVKVFVRVRPSNKKEEKSASCILVRDQSSVILDAKPPKIFTYDYVADEDSTQVSYNTDKSMHMFNRIAGIDIWTSR